VYKQKIMSYPIDLSITGKPSPRTNDRVASAGRRQPTPMNQNKQRNQKSNIFGGGGNAARGNESNPRYQTKNVAGVISKRDLESVRKLTDPNPAENKNVASYPSPRKVAPAGVPQLSFGDVVERDEDMTYSKVPPKMSTISPTSKDTYSWGTPINPNNNIKGGGWQVNQSRKATKPVSSHRKHDDVPDLNLQLSQSNQGLAQLRQTAKQVQEDLNIEYILRGETHANTASKTQNHQPAKVENKYTKKKAAFVEEIFLMDQILKTKITDEKPPSVSCLANANQARYNSKVKRHQDMHSTSAASNSLVNDDLSRRLHFSARILSLNGHDARRDINGFLFIDDNSITLYEFKQFGTTSKALPLIQRGIYKHLSGVRTGRAYSILDISVGKDLSFDTNELNTLPDSLKKKKVLVFRVTNVNEEDKEILLKKYCKSVKDSKLSTVYQFKEAHEKEDRQDKQSNKDVLSIQNRIHQQVKAHGYKLFTNLHHYFTQLDSKKGADGCLDRDEFKDALKKFRILLNEQEFDNVWRYVDRNNDGLIDYGEFVRGCFGEMSETRKFWVRKAFSRIDPAKTGSGKIIDIQKFYCPAKDSAVVSGKISESEALDKIVECFQRSRSKTEVSYTEFEAYYEGLSLNFSDDDTFIHVVKNTWTL